MIKLKVTNKGKEGIKNSFVFESDQPVTMSFVETEEGHIVAYIYKGVGDEIDENTDPIACFDTDLVSNDFLIK